MPATTATSITPNLWFDTQAEEAAEHYCSIFPNSKIVHVARYPESTDQAGQVMVVEWELDGQRFVGINGGPLFTFSEAVSFQVSCDTQDEIDFYWEKLGEGGDPKAQQCGWLKDRFGLSWQVVPTEMDEWMHDPESPGTRRAFEAMLRMKKLDIAELRRAKEGAA